jgi:oligosaccharide repeat unit polymerase
MKIISLNKDIYFIIYICIALMYGVLMPILSDTTTGIVSWYYEAIFLMFFIFPVFIVYKILPNNDRPNLNININISFLKVKILVFLVFVTTCIFLYITIDNVIFFRRIGHEALAIRSSNMGAMQAIFSRLFEENSIFISLVLHIFIRSTPVLNFKILKFFIFFFIFIVMIYFLVNSRMQLMVFLLSNFVIYVFYEKITIKKILKLTLLLFISFWIVLISRSAIVSQEANLNSIAYEINNEVSIVDRLNGIRILVDVHDDISRKGLMLGEGWSNAALYYYLIFDKDKYDHIKSHYLTTTKSIIYKYYKGDDIKDMPSSVVTDVYPNFGIFGLILAGFTIGFLLHLIKAGLSNTRGASMFLFSLYLMPIVLQVEKEFISLLFMILKYSPVLLLLLVFNPFLLGKLKK